MKKFFTKKVLTGATAIVVYLMVMNFVLHMAVNSKYGLFFDEYYYYSMSSHLSFGYLDAPPITGWLMALSRLLLGDSIPAMHVCYVVRRFHGAENGRRTVLTGFNSLSGNAGTCVYDLFRYVHL